MARRTNTRNPFEVAQSTGTTLLDQTTVELRFDYESISEEHREMVRRSALAIKPRLKRAAEDIFVIGRELGHVKKHIGHGSYTQWLDVEFGLSDRMAQHFMNVADRLGTREKVLVGLSPTTLYQLAAPSTPDEAIEEVQDRLETGETISVTYVQSVIKRAKERKKQQTPGTMTIEGEVLSSDGVSREERDRRAKGQRIEQVLALMLRQLDVPLLDDWHELFDNEELHRLRKETAQLQQKLLALFAVGQTG
ncbi:MAG: DUF3102 domain-containing protein [Caldilineaceae bacterium]|nr:DUF3102 domain-containing protein [Caldilineaceae bacterium]